VNSELPHAVAPTLAAVNAMSARGSGASSDACASGAPMTALLTRTPQNGHAASVRRDVAIAVRTGSQARQVSSPSSARGEPKRNTPDRFGDFCRHASAAGDARNVFFHDLEATVVEGITRRLLDLHEPFPPPAARELEPRGDDK